MRQIIVMGVLCAIGMPAWAGVELFGIARDLNDNTHLVKIDPTDALSMQVVAPLDVSGVSWLAYNPLSNTLNVHSDTQVYRVNPETGETTAFDQPAGVPQMQGLDFIPGPGLMTAYGSRGNAFIVGKIETNGQVSLRYSYGSLLDFDELVWDDVRDQIYVSATQERVLYTIDGGTGALLNTIILPAGSGNIARASIHPETGVMYEVSVNQSQLQNTIYLRDPVTGERTGSIGTLPGYSSIHGLAFTPEPGSVLGLIVVGMALLRRRTA